MKNFLWIAVIILAIYYLVTKYTVPSGSAQVGSAPGGGGSSGGGGGLLGLLGFGSSSPAIDLGQGSAATSNANTINPPAIGAQSTPFNTSSGLQPRVLNPLRIVATAPQPIAPSSSTPGATAPSAVAAPVTTRNPINTPTPYGMPHYRSY